MKVMIEFQRDESCPHSSMQQCAACWKREMADYLGESEAEFEAHWRTRIGYTPDDEVPETYSQYGSYTVPALEKKE